MGAAAGAGISAGERNDSYPASQRLFAPVFQCCQLFRRREGDGDGVVFPDIAVGRLLQLLELVSVQQYV